MKKRTKTLLRRRRQVVKEWASGPYDWTTTGAIHFSGTELPFAGTAEEADEIDKQIEEQVEKRRRWLQRLFPNEMWRIPTLTSMLLPEAGFSYINGVFYATIVMCQAVVESVLRREAGGYGKEYWRLVRKLHNAGKLTAKERDSLVWLASIRNPSLHTGSYTDYAKALARGMAPIIAHGRVTERYPIESDCKRALKIVVRLLHHLCPESPQQDY